MKKGTYLIARRLTQSGILLLFFAGNAFDWKILRGNLSSAKLLNTIPLSDPFAALQISTTGILLAENAIVGAVIIFLFYAVIGGRGFCGWVCPVNMVTDLANRLRSVFILNTQQKSQILSRGIRYWIMALALMLSALIGIAAFEWISPISALHRGIIYGMGLGWAFVAAVFLFDLFAVKNGFCGHICPLGGFYALAGRFGILRIIYDEEKCTLCMKCTDICPEKQVLHMVGRQSGPVTSGECINCGRCIEVCDADAVHFGNIYSKKSTHTK